MTILREDATFAWVGPTTLTRSGGTVRLTVRITDMADGNRGDVGTATVAFINRGTGATLGTAARRPRFRRPDDRDRNVYVDGGSGHLLDWVLGNPPIPPQQHRG